MFADSLPGRWADVMLREQRKLVPMLRETHLHAGHCKLVDEVTRLRAVTAPPMPAFCSSPNVIDDQLD